MQFKLLDNKPTITNIKDNNIIIDLITPSVRYDNERYNIIDAFYVGDDMVMRADLISYVSYGDQDFWDLILKFNGVSNPFSVDENDLLYVPDLSWMQGQLVDNSNQNNSNYSLNSSIDPTKKLPLDTKRIEYEDFAKKLLTINKNAKVVKEQLTPNMAPEGSDEIKIFDNNKVILGG